MRPTVQGLSHGTLVVHDLARSAALLVDVPGAEEVHRSDGREHSLMAARFFVLGGVWIALMEGEREAGHSCEHVAFEVREEDMDAWEQRLREAGVDSRPGRPRVPGGGNSLCFHDRDDHLLELHSGSLEQRLACYRGDGS